MIPVIRRAVPYDNEVEWKSIYIPQTRSAERLAVPKSKGNPNLKDSRAALQARDLEQPGTLEGRPILVKRALPARLAQAFYVA